MSTVLTVFTVDILCLNDMMKTEYNESSDSKLGSDFVTNYMLFFSILKIILYSSITNPTISDVIRTNFMLINEECPFFAETNKNYEHVGYIYKCKDRDHV